MQPSRRSTPDWGEIVRDLDTQLDDILTDIRSGQASGVDAYVTASNALEALDLYMRAIKQELGT